jgi:hypothetical protein
VEQLMPLVGSAPSSSLVHSVYIPVKDDPKAEEAADNQFYVRKQDAETKRSKRVMMFLTIS